jgi:DNA-binding transcriptional regulator YdaS (Cro superfamily)
MELKTYLSPLSQEQREEFAKRCESTKGHLQNVMYGMKTCATDLAVHIERESKGAVRRWELRPLDWYKHWPELIGTEGAPDVPKTPATPAQATETVAGEPHV